VNPNISNWREILIRIIELCDELILIDGMTDERFIDREEARKDLKKLEKILWREWHGKYSKSSERIP